MENANIYIYNELNKEFNFDFDPCPFKSSFDGLKIDWGKRNFVNPPYSKVKEFLIKALEQLKQKNNMSVFLVFANTDTRWFHDLVYNKFEIRFLKGRLKFLDENNNVVNSAMRPSMLIILK